MKKPEKEPVVALVRKQVNNALRFSPRAWAKLIWLRDRGNTEISVFGVSTLADLLYIDDVKIIKQVASMASFDFDDEYLNHYLVDMVAAGRQPCEVMRIWIHTHPGGATPSGVDIATFDRTTKNADWGIMCIVGNDDATYARMRMRVSGGAIAIDVSLDVKVDWSGEFIGVTNEDAKQWNADYKECVTRAAPIACTRIPYANGGFGDGRAGYRHVTGYSEAWGGVNAEDDDRGFLFEDADRGFLPEGATGFLPDKEEEAAADCPSSDDGIDDYFGAQKIYLIELDSSGDTVVYTEQYWFQYLGTPELKVKEDAEVGSPRGICEESPEFWGEVKWSPEGDKETIVYKATLYHDGAFLPVGAEAAEADSTSAEEVEQEKEEPQSEPVGP